VKLPHMRRRTRLLRNLLLALLLCAAAWLAMGCPCFTAGAAFRRMEKQYLTGGPAEIVATLDARTEYLTVGLKDDYVLIAANGRVSTDILADGLLRIPYWAPGILRCFPRKEESTLLFCGNYRYDASYSRADPVFFLLDRHPEAAEAEMTLRLAGEVELNGVSVAFDETYSARAARVGEGIFLLCPPAKETEQMSFGWQRERAMFNRIFGSIFGRNDSLPVFEAAVRYYDAGGALLAEERVAMDARMI